MTKLQRAESHEQSCGHGCRSISPVWSRLLRCTDAISRRAFTHSSAIQTASWAAVLQVTAYAGIMKSRLAPQSVLVISLSRLGDALLTTPLIRTLKTNWPHASLDVLVFDGTEDILAHNPDIGNVVTVAQQPSLPSHVQFLAKLFRRYDLAMTTQTGDRPTFYAYWAGRHRIGLRDKDAPWWKRWLLSEAVVFDNRNTHTSLMNLQLATLLGLPPTAEVTVCWNAHDMNVVNDLLGSHIGKTQYAVLHPVPQFNYKKWHVQGWRDIAVWLHNKGIAAIVTGSNKPSEITYIKGIVEPIPDTVLSLVGQLSLTQVGYLLSRSRLYVGPDTVTTHMAAALGVPTIALFGPSNPVKWGPWPKQWPLTNPYVTKGSQRRNNVLLLQGQGDCVPCFMEGCDRHVASHSDCLATLDSLRVIAAAEKLLHDSISSP